METRFIINAIAWLLAVVGASCVFAGFVIIGFFIFLSGFGLTTVDYEDEIQ